MYPYIKNISGFYSSHWSNPIDRVYAAYKSHNDGSVELTNAQKNAMDKIELLDCTNSNFGTL